MKNKIGFGSEFYEDFGKAAPQRGPEPTILPRPSLVQVHFPERGLTLSYYNDRFELHPGDYVYVDGKLEGLRGRVTEVSYHFRIRLSDYKRVTAVADTRVRGQFFFAGSHLLTFDRAALPYEKVLGWFRAPAEDEEFACGYDDTAFLLDEPHRWPVSEAVAERGLDYYSSNKVRYLCLDGTRGRALVEGRELYEVEFTYEDGEIRNPFCSCYCSGFCKHEAAALLQLRETLDRIETHYAEAFAQSGYFAAVYRGTFCLYALDVPGAGSLTLN